jgi:hypothetical protein
MEYPKLRLESALERLQQAGLNQHIEEVGMKAIADDLAQQRASLFGKA